MIIPIFTVYASIISSNVSMKQFVNWHNKSVILCNMLHMGRKARKLYKKQNVIFKWDSVIYQFVTGCALQLLL